MSKVQRNLQLQFLHEEWRTKSPGILAHKAKACGLASVSELLEVEGFDKFAYQKRPKLSDAFNEGSHCNNESVLETDFKAADVAQEKKKLYQKVSLCNSVPVSLVIIGCLLLQGQPTKFSILER